MAVMKPSLCYPFLFIRSYGMPHIGFYAWIQSDGGDFVAILSYKSGTNENYAINRKNKAVVCPWMPWYKVHMYSFYTTTATAIEFIHPNLGRNWIAEWGKGWYRPTGKTEISSRGFCCCLLFYGDANGSWKGKQWLQIWCSWRGNGGKTFLHSIPFQVKM